MSTAKNATANLNQLLELQLPSPVQRFRPDWEGADNIEIWIKRDDLIHPIISGNKWRKLSQLLIREKENLSHIISFGGGYSNHLHALGWCCKKLSIPFTAIIRGNYTKNPTPMIEDLLAWNTSIQYVSKIEYKQRHNAEYLNHLQQLHPTARIIPEGGSEASAISGISEMLTESQQNFDVCIVPVASGATLAGIARAQSPNNQAIGIAVLNGVGYLEGLVEQFLPCQSGANWQIVHGFEHGGYAKSSPALVRFCEHMSTQYKLTVEPVYSGKVFYALKQLLKDGFFAPGQRLLVVHTGGLQGAR